MQGHSESAVKPLIISILAVGGADAIQALNTLLGTISIGLSIAYTVYKFRNEKKQ